MRTGYRIDRCNPRRIIDSDQMVRDRNLSHLVVVFERLEFSFSFTFILLFFTLSFRFAI